MREAYDPGEDWASDIFIGLNLAPITVDYGAGLIWKSVISSPEIGEMLNKLEAEAQEQ